MSEMVVYLFGTKLVYSELEPSEENRDAIWIDVEYNGKVIKELKELKDNGLERSKQ
jgi:hypothetical protein